jgi:hypothetical protein
MLILLFRLNAKFKQKERNFGRWLLAVSKKINFGLWLLAVGKKETVKETLAVD